jgi:hypothetical protein
VSDAFAVETSLFGHEFVVGLFASREFEFLFVQVDAVRGVRFSALSVFVSEFHAKQVFEAVVIGLIQGQLKGLFFDEDHSGGMEAVAAETGFTGGGVVIDVASDSVEVFGVFLEFDGFAVAVPTAEGRRRDFDFEIFFATIGDGVQGDFLIAPEGDLRELVVRERGHGVADSFFSVSDVCVHIAFLFRVSFFSFH